MCMITVYITMKLPMLHRTFPWDLIAITTVSLTIEYLVSNELIDVQAFGQQIRGHGRNITSNISKGSNG